VSGGGDSVIGYTINHLIAGVRCVSWRKLIRYRSRLYAIRRCTTARSGEKKYTLNRREDGQGKEHQKQNAIDLQIGSPGGRRKGSAGRSAQLEQSRGEGEENWVVKGRIHVYLLGFVVKLVAAVLVEFKKGAGFTAGNHGIAAAKHKTMKSSQQKENIRRKARGTCGEKANCCRPGQHQRRTW